MFAIPLEYLKLTRADLLWSRDRSGYNSTGRVASDRKMLPALATARQPGPDREESGLQRMPQDGDAPLVAYGSRSCRYAIRNARSIQKAGHTMDVHWSLHAQNVNGSTDLDTCDQIDWSKQRFRTRMSKVVEQ